MADDNHHHDDGGGFLTGMIFGGIVGFVAGMVLAPRSGDETRTVLSERGQELRDKADDFIAAARERMFAASDRGDSGAPKREYPFDDLDLDEEEL